MGASSSAPAPDEFDADPAAFRRAVTDALMSPRAIAVQPLIEIVLRYALEFRGFVTTIVDSSKSPPDTPLEFVTHVRVQIDSNTGAKHYFFSDQLNQTFHSVPAAGGVPALVAGRGGECAFVSSTVLESRFQAPTSMCFDPTNCNRLYLCEYASIRVLDRTGGGGGTVTLLAGSAIADGWVDGAGSDVRFHCIADMVCTSDGQTLYVADSASCRLRRVNTKSGAVTTIAGTGRAETVIRSTARESGVNYPHALALAVAPSDAVLYISCVAEILRLDARSGAMSAVNNPALLRPFGIAALPNGWLVVTCARHRSLYAIDPSTGATERIAGSGELTGGGGMADGAALTRARFGHPLGVCIDGEEQCAIVADQKNRSLRRVTLPPRLFKPQQQQQQPS